MKFLEFREQTAVIAKDQKEYLPLPAHQVGDDSGTTFVKIGLSDEEVEYIVKNRSMFMSVLTFGKLFGKDNYNFPPLMLYAKNPFPYIQDITPEMGAIYFSDIDLVTFYNPTTAEPLLQVPNENFNRWIPCAGFVTFGSFNVEKVEDIGKPVRIRLFVSWDRKKGKITKLNHQFYNREDDHG